MAWAAAWLYRYTKEDSYYNDAVMYYNKAAALMNGVSEFSWNSKLPGVQVCISQLPKCPSNTAKTFFQYPKTPFQYPQNKIVKN